jgi:hypothetical protein
MLALLLLTWALAPRGFGHHGRFASKDLGRFQL